MFFELFWPCLGTRTTCFAENQKNKNHVHPSKRGVHHATGIVHQFIFFSGSAVLVWEAIIHQLTTENMKKKMLQLMLLLFAGLGLRAQTNPANLIRTDLIPPSPTAAGLARYGEIPINLATGSVGFSIPIFNASGNELS